MTPPLPLLEREALAKKVLPLLHRYKYGKTAMQAGKTMRKDEGLAEAYELADLLAERIQAAQTRARIDELESVPVYKAAPSVLWWDASDVKKRIKALKAELTSLNPNGEKNE